MAFRFRVDQAGKLRARDDLKHALTNTACQIKTPIWLVSRGHVSQLCFEYATGEQYWALF